MGLIERLQQAMRAFKAGPAVVSQAEMVYGHDESMFSPREYGDYLATSNAVYACATLRADMLASIPLRCYQVVDGRKREVPSGPVNDLMRKVNDYWTMNRLMEMTELSLCVWGRAFWAVERGLGQRGEPQELWWMKPDRVRVYVDPVRYVRAFGYAPEDGGQEILFAPQEVIWFRFPNPLDEFSGLSPLAAARLAADLASSAAQTNKRLFDQGYMLGGIVVPDQSVTLTKEQAEELEKSLDRRFKGEDKAHRWGVFRFKAEIKGMNVTPKDAEFLGALEWSLEEVARAYKVPLDMIGGQRTYENVQAAERAFWFRTMEPESRFIASEITEQLLPMFRGTGVDLVEFDLSRVPILQDAEGEQWRRSMEQIQVGAITINEWRTGQGKDPVSWGDVYWAPMNLAPVSTADDADEKIMQMGKAEEQPRMQRGAMRMVEVGSAEHERLWRKFERRTVKWQKRIGEMTAGLMERQRESVRQKMQARMLAAAGNGNGQRTVEEAAADPFDMAEWVKKFRVAMRDLLIEMVEDVGSAAMEDLAVNILFQVTNPEVMRFIERRAQRFAVEVNQTTWDELRTSLSAGLQEGDGLTKLMERVEEAMAGRIRSSREVIARTEAIGATNGGTLEAWRQSGVVRGKAWISALLPERTRASHEEAHRRYNDAPIGLDTNFEVGAGAGPHPGAIGLAEEDINCLCTMVAIVE